MAAEAFAVMREGMAGKAGIGKVALYGREYLVAVRPQKKGLVMYTLRRSLDLVSKTKKKPAKVTLTAVGKSKGKGHKAPSVKKAAAG